jgi:hypothetical protein
MKDSIHSDNGVPYKKVQLHTKDKRYYAIGFSPITTLTWFQGDYRIATPWLVDRAQRIVKANPWLTGRIRPDPIPHTTNNNGVDLCLVYQEETVADQFSSHCVIFSPETSPVALHMTMDELEGATHAWRPTSSGPNELLWKVLIFPCRNHPTQHFAVVMSLSHVLGDGCSFYEIYNMLCCSNKPVKALIVERIPGSESQQADLLGHKELHYQGRLWFRLFYKWGYWINAIKSFFYGRPIMRCLTLHVDDKAIQTLKAREVETKTVPFVSTNDVLCSWLLNASQTQESFMVVNFRNRLKGHTRQHVGNYHGFLMLQSPDFSKPSLIRHSLPQLRRTITHDRLPGVWQTLLGFKAFVSNWTTFQEPLDIPHCQTGVHMPLYSVKRRPLNTCVMFIYAPNPGRTAVLCIGEPHVLHRFKHLPFLQ